MSSVVPGYNLGDFDSDFDDIEEIIEHPGQVNVTFDANVISQTDGTGIILNAGSTGLKPGTVVKMNANGYVVPVNKTYTFKLKSVPFNPIKVGFPPGANYCLNGDYYWAEYPTSNPADVIYMTPEEKLMSMPIQELVKRPSWLKAAKKLNGTT